ncbi:flagellar hook-length control protein FliK [Erwinia tasmaniensis]|uniref:Flagellar hook-length control protein n=1 Tax=Erwinia tasmaniensis (strain DSM 17950 / CFBP 7177 / CIP 109463 / NCPPB 4357 / Et1/99) TaxID=465817 RepID=B2VDP4_ERWT9|nr:flagellar hook-length control protein FliK [Erwinia tasmaniensis]CAO97039.1 Flagellar hook-length control protein [Erwinia tasmaniensis Et1/99]
MITLPTAATSTSSKTTASLNSDNVQDSRVDGDPLSGAENLPQGFVTLLGNRLLSLAQQGATHAQTGEVGSGAAAETGGKSKATSAVNALLATLDNPDTLSNLLQTAAEVTGKKGDEQTDDPATPVTALSANDLQALQALYAMLPNQAITPVNTTQAHELTEAALNKSDKQSMLDALSTAAGKTHGENDEPSDTLTGKNSDGGGQTKAADKPGVRPEAGVSSAAQGGDPAFQSLISGAGKENVQDKHQPESSLNAPTTHGSLMTATAALVPTTTSAVSAPATPFLNAQLGSPEWQQALGQQILMFSRNGLQTAELRLHPQDLGSIQISLKLDNDHAQLSLVSNHSQVRDALEAALPQLRASMAESGINLGQSNVSSDNFQQGKSFNGQQEQRRDNTDTPFSLGSEGDGDTTPIAVPVSLQARATGANAVDIFA